MQVIKVYFLTDMFTEEKRERGKGYVFVGFILNLMMYNLCWKQQLLDV